ncbi:hypothetical protein HUK65_07985 [Rhodobacteraceae bacterium 2376]|uniref:Uncharacterized protein n=1 Tax=Rhabdonatronobacter sediminivivens TaxID=2743469 RepID=A0A7Z0HZK5_9RHOB|nr:hypothetical protein [Rhabdonatronobacter sediminivivens]NYS24932.1 hypothetical protein [Rhabdonatronobacter sediminivivens]
MVPVKPLKLAAVALVGALGSGYALQLLDGEDAASRGQTAQMAGPSLARPSPPQAGTEISGALVSLPGREARDIVSGDRIVQTAALDDAPAPGLQFTPPAETDSAAAPDCAMTLSLSPGAAGTITATLTAPCNGGEAVSITHDKLRFDDRMPESGPLTVILPALKVDATVQMSLPGAEAQHAQVTVPEAADYARTVLQWSGTPDFALHAFHGETGFGQPGHVHALNPVDPGAQGAFTLTLGHGGLEQPRLAHVHSVPAASADPVHFAIAAQHNGDTCGRVLQAETFVNAPRATTSVPVTVHMDSCETEASFVMLPVPQPLELAAN